MLAAFSVTPLGAGESVGDHIAEAVRIVRASGQHSETNAMSTNVPAITAKRSASRRAAAGRWLRARGLLRGAGP